MSDENQNYELLTVRFVASRLFKSMTKLLV